MTLLRLVRHAGAGVVISAVTLNVLIGVLPIGFVIGMGLALGRDARYLAPAIGCLAVQQVLAPFQLALGELVSRRVDGHCVQRLMAASFRDTPVADLSLPSTLDRLGDVRAAFDRTVPTPGDAAAGALALIARYAQLAGAVALVGAVLHVGAAVVVGVTALVIRAGQRGSLRRVVLLWDTLSGPRRRAQYVRGLATGPHAAKEIRVLGLLGWLRARHRTEARAYLDRLWAGRRRLLFWPFVGSAVVGLAGGAIALAGTARGGLTVLQLAIAIQAVLITMRFGVYFPECDVQTQFGGQSHRALVEFCDVAPASRGGLPAEAPRGAIRFEGVGFAYPGGPPVFDGLDLSLAAGRSTAIVGLNGAGKTTLVKLLAGFYRPSTGRITVDGRDLRSLDPVAWQRLLAVVFQDFVRYELTAAENVGLGVADEAALRAAAERADASSLVDDRPVFSRYAGGRDLSGGQWQRIALARAYFRVHRGASVLVLDEPTAQLDVRAEVEFFDQFLSRFGLATTVGLTTVVISHRFSTVRRAEQIVVLDGGRVVERGTHDTLVSAGGRYARMFRLQADRFAEVSP